MSGDELGRVHSGVRKGSTVSEVAAVLSLDPADVREFLARIGEPGEEISYEVLDEVHREFDPHCERTVPQAYGQSGDEI